MLEYTFNSSTLLVSTSESYQRNSPHNITLELPHEILCEMGVHLIRRSLESLSSEVRTTVLLHLNSITQSCVNLEDISESKEFLRLYMQGIGMPTELVRDIIELSVEVAFLRKSHGSTAFSFGRFFSSLHAQLPII